MKKNLKKIGTMMVYISAAISIIGLVIFFLTGLWVTEGDYAPIYCGISCLVPLMMILFVAGIIILIIGWIKEKSETESEYVSRRIPPRRPSNYDRKDYNREYPTKNPTNRKRKINKPNVLYFGPISRRKEEDKKI